MLISIYITRNDGTFHAKNNFLNCQGAAESDNDIETVPVTI